jgi:hypothetical protein
VRAHSATAAARAAEPSCSPWSTVTSPARKPARGATKAVAAARARESAPPEQATSTDAAGPPGRDRRAARTAFRTAATDGAILATTDPGYVASPTGPCTRATQASGSPSSSSRGSVSGELKILLKPSMPTRSTTPWTNL